MITWLSVFLWSLVFAIALASPVKSRPSESVEGGSTQTDLLSASNGQHIFLAGLNKDKSHEYSSVFFQKQVSWFPSVLFFIFKKGCSKAD